MLSKILFSCWLITVITSVSNAGSTIRIVQISDVQIGFTEARAREAGTITGNGMDSDYFARAVEMINNLKPKADIVVNTGDLVNDPSSMEQWNCFNSISQRLKPRLYEVMGNHDGWTTEGVKEFQNRFGEADYYTFKVKNCRFIVLNSWYFKERDKNPESAEKQKLFLENLLRNDKSAFRVIMLHFPVFTETSEENDAYFNLPLGERKWLLHLAVKYKVKLILSGHSHRNIIKTYRDSVTLITTGPISEPLGLNDDKTASKRGFRIIDIDLSKGTFTHQFITLPESRITEDKGFSFVFLGDLHFDKQGHHDIQWVLKTHPADTSQIRYYCDRTKFTFPALYNDIRTLCAKDASLVVQSGDFTEGLCGNYTLAERQLNEFIHFTENMIHAPFLISKGNHDITGPGADSAYKSIIFPFLARQTGNQIHDSKYVYIKDNTAFFFYDSYDRTSLDWLAEQMKKFRDVPVKFVIMHEPVVPINARSKWTEFSGASEKENHDRLLELLGDNNAIVLAGHLHAYGLVVRKTNHGRFIQLSGSSVVDNLNQEPDQVISGINSYGVSLIDLEPGFSPADKDERRAILLKEKPFILYFEYALLQGYMVIHVNQEKITAELYTGTGLKKWKTVDLTGLLKN